MRKNNFWVSIGLLASFVAAVLPQKAHAGQKYALLVGVNRYQHPRLTELRFCENDVSELAEVLQSGNYQVTMLRGAEATKGNIEQRLKGLLRAARADDSVIVAFAGHGLQFQQDAYFCPVDGRPFPDETTGLVSLTQVYQDIDHSFARVKVMLVDACRNDGTRGLRGVDGDNSPRPPRGVAAFFSCAAGEVAHEHERFRHGVFFHYILKGLRGQARNARGQVTFASLVDYVSAEVTDAVHQLISEGAKQSPNMKADLQGASPVLFFAGAPVVEKRDADGQAKIANLLAQANDQRKILDTLHADKNAQSETIAALQAKLQEQQQMIAGLYASKKERTSQPKYDDPRSLGNAPADSLGSTGYTSPQLAVVAPSSALGQQETDAVHKALRAAGLHSDNVETVEKDLGNQCYWAYVRVDQLSGSTFTNIYRVGMSDLRVSFQRREHADTESNLSVSMPPPIAPPP